MAKVIFFNIPAQGHINPALPVIAELVRRGEQVICVNTEDTRAQMQSTGAAFQPYPPTEAVTTQIEALIRQASSGNMARNALALNQIGEQTLPFVFELLQREKPDYVIYDALCGWAKQAVEKLQIPGAAFIVTFALGKELPPGGLGMLANFMGKMIPLMPRFLGVARRVRRDFGVKPVWLPMMNTGSLNIVFTSSQLQPGADSFENNYHFVGPSMSARPETVEFPFEQLNRQPVVYISLGTINNDNIAFYQQCFAAFQDQPGVFILSVGKRTDLNSLGAIPANFIVRNFVPQLEVLQRSDVFVTHGGLGSVHEGLWYTVPMVVIPQQIEQAMVAREIVRQGAGVALGLQAPIGRTTVEALRGAVQQVLSDHTGFKAVTARLGEGLKAAGGYARAADLLIEFSQRAPRVIWG